jgi:hypothetical protein
MICLVPVVADACAGPQVVGSESLKPVAAFRIVNSPTKCRGAYGNTAYSERRSARCDNCVRKLGLWRQRSARPVTGVHLENTSPRA